MRQRPSYPVLNAAIRNRLGGEWISPRQLAEQLALWEVTTVRHALRIMADRGECETRSEDVHSAKRMNFYRAQAPA